MGDNQDDITDVIRRHWDYRASGFDDEDAHGLVSEEQHGAWLNLLAPLAGSSPQRVLDIGCGTGFLALRFAELGHTVTGVDLAPQMIDRATRKAEGTRLSVDFQVGDAVAVAFPDETFDLVVARHVIWNLPDPGRAVVEWVRVLRPGGRLALIEGKWASNEASALRYSRPASRIAGRILRAVAELVRRVGSPAARKLLLWRYRRIEAQLPFSGGPPASKLALFLEANHVQGVEIKSLMESALWGEKPRYPRYLVVGTRPVGAEPRRADPP